MFPFFETKEQNDEKKGREKNESGITKRLRLPYPFNILQIRIQNRSITFTLLQF